MNNDVSKKRKKTSREKRVLVASLGIAAVVAAGSTFAWFTSQDEVTNRLSANAAYDVSVIETFTPPTNWIPGQRVNKDTSAVNTGNIPAFVKQKLSGKMQVTLEQAEKTFDLSTEDSSTTKKKKYVELTEDEVDVIEAGGFLAYAFNTVIDPATGNSTTTKIGIEKGGDAEATTDQCYLGEVSAVHSGKNFDLIDPTKDKTEKENENFFGSDIQFAPPATGDYIFRRVIDVANDGTETYEYKGYHFEADTGKYYQIKVINGVLPEEDGILTVAPTVYYGVEVNDIADLPLRYEPAAERKYLQFQASSASPAIKKQYNEKTPSIPNEYGDLFTKYTVDNGAGEFSLDYYVCTAVAGNPRSAAQLGTIYTSLPAAGPVGKVTSSADNFKEKDYDIEINTPDRLVATYEVAKSDDVFIGTPTDLSDFTADNYDAKRREIAYSDYLIAEKNYKNKEAQYELNKNLYEAGTALLTALAKNEKILADKQGKVDAAMAGFDGEIENLVFTAPANVTPFTTGADAIKTAFGAVSEKQLPKVNNFKVKVNNYKANPNNTNWAEVVGAYAEVNTIFTEGNAQITELENKIVSAWKEAALDKEYEDLIKVADIGDYELPANASPDSKAVKEAAKQLIEWEKEIFKYQKAVNKYFASLSDVQSDAEYKLQDLRPLEKAYKDAVNDNTKLESITNEKYSGDTQTTIATKIIPGNPLTVDPNCKITVGGGPVEGLSLNGSKPVPIKNSISDDGYSGTKIANITGLNQFKIGDKVIADLYNDDGTLKKYDELVPDEVEAKNAAERDYNTKKAVYDRYQTEHTNQDANNDIVIYINLANIGDGTKKDQWKLTPTLVPGSGNGAVDKDGNLLKEANFYYTSILGGGEVSSILVDSVELSGDTTNYAFKEFDFDLNVTVDSAQVVVSEDGRSYESTAVNANPEFFAKPSEPKYDKEQAKPVKDNTIVDWT